MTANKDLYRYLYRKICRGMGYVKRGSSIRFELLINDPSTSLWKSISEQTNATGQDLDKFLQGVRGYFKEESQVVKYQLQLNEILPGEILSFVYRLPDNINHGETKILKLDRKQYLVISSKNSSWQSGAVYNLDANIKIHRFNEVTLPKLGNVKLSNVCFDVPSEFHRLLDVSLLRGFRKAKVKDDIVPLFEWLKLYLSGNLSPEMLDELFQLTAEFGISTYAVRKMIDCIFSLNFVRI